MDSTPADVRCIQDVHTAVEVQDAVSAALRGADEVTVGSSEFLEQWDGATAELNGWEGEDRHTLDVLPRRNCGLARLTPNQ